MERYLVGLLAGVIVASAGWILGGLILGGEKGTEDAPSVQSPTPSEGAVLEAPTENNDHPHPETNDEFGDDAGVIPAEEI